MNDCSAPSPEECIFNITLKKGGNTVVKALHYIFQKCWSKAVLPEAFVTDANVMLPKPGKTDYNFVWAQTNYTGEYDR